LWIRGYEADPRLIQLDRVARILRRRLALEDRLPAVDERRPHLLQVYVGPFSHIVAIVARFPANSCIEFDAFV